MGDKMKKNDRQEIKWNKTLRTKILLMLVPGLIFCIIFFVNLILNAAARYGERDIKPVILTIVISVYVLEGPFFSERKKLSASNRPKDVVRRAAKFRVDSYSSFVDSPLEALRPPLLRDMQSIPHRTIFALEKKTPAGHLYICF